MDTCNPKIFIYIDKLVIGEYYCWTHNRSMY